MQFSSILPAGIAAAYWNWVQKVLVTSLCVHLLVWSPFCSKPSLLVPVLCPYFYWSRSILFNDLIAFFMKSWSFTKKAFPSFLPVKQASVSCFLWSPLQGFLFSCLASNTHAYTTHRCIAGAYQSWVQKVSMTWGYAYGLDRRSFEMAFSNPYSWPLLPFILISLGRCHGNVISQDGVSKNSLFW